MSDKKDPVRHMLTLALATALNDLEYYEQTLEKTTAPQVRALLNVLAESEEDLIDRIEHMMFAGVLDAVDESKRLKGIMKSPNDEPFDFASPFSSSIQFQRWSLCNETLQRGMKAHSFYLSIAARAKSGVVTALFEYLAHLKSLHIERLRKVCESFDEDLIHWSTQPSTE
ncbi:MAG: hypothetical protein ACXADS_00740 [Candidatus Thorarchaeota archaeon]|jgi:rubrerythrin